MPREKSATATSIPSPSRIRSAGSRRDSTSGAPLPRETEPHRRRHASSPILVDPGPPQLR
jgi:hypothetical protein